MGRLTVSATAIVGLILATCTAQATVLIWDNTSGNMLWSTGTNWNPDIAGLPGSGDTATFDKTTAAAAAGTLTNTVDGSLTIAGLTYSLSSAASASTHHTTVINSGQTLTVNGPFSAGFESGTAVGTVASVTIKGSTAATGALVVNAGSAPISFGTAIYDYPTGTRTFTADLSGLGTFNATTTGLFYLAWGFADISTLTLADTNTITAGQIAVGGWNVTNQINLGRSNVLNANSITLCRSVAGVLTNTGTSVIQFASGLTNPSVTIRNSAGTGRADVTVGYGGDSSGSNVGRMDFYTGTSGTGYVDALLGTLIIGQGSETTTYGASGIGTFTFGAGIVDATLVRVGYTKTGSYVNNKGTGTLDINGPGTLRVSTLTVADMQGSGLATGTVNLYGGTLQATTI